MDYNKPNRGVVCFFYNLMQKRLFFVSLALVATLFVVCLKILTNNEVPEANTAFYALCVLASALLFIAINPAKFLIKLVGFLLSIVSLFVALHNVNKLDLMLFYALLAFGAMLLYLLLSWFVYNARSSEVNEL